MKTNREKALEWWSQLSIAMQMAYSQNHFTRDDSVNLTNHQIEEIWRKETQNTR